MRWYSARRLDLRARLLALGVCGLFGCGGGDSTAPNELTGMIYVSVTTGGDDRDADGYDFTLNGGTPSRIELNGQFPIEDLAPGDYQLALSGIASNCAVAEANPQMVTVVGGSRTDAKFTVTCTLMVVVPPGRDIALVRNDEVYLLSADGSTFANLTKNLAIDLHPTWSPDGRKIAFSSGHFEGSWPYLVEISNIFAMNADGSGRTQLTTTPRGRGVEAVAAGHRHDERRALGGSQGEGGRAGVAPAHAAL